MVQTINYFKLITTLLKILLKTLKCENFEIMNFDIFACNSIFVHTFQ
ncbi:MAG: hypothetical protein RLZZ241_1473 [Bacteroidota bacterium]|jgi:hypothetical protein